MSIFDTQIAAYQFNRTRTLGLLERIEQEPNPQAVLAWRPGPGRAHIGWQLMHIGVTEDIFASERLAPSKKGLFSDLWPRFRGGSTPDDDVPTPAALRKVLGESRDALLATLQGYDESRLDEIPPSLAERKLTVRDVLFIVSWHEGHHQGQSHLTFNLYKNQK